MTNQAPIRASPLEPGFRLDRYELLCVLAHGGMATIWLARMQGKHGFEKLVAVKTILPSFAEEGQFQRMFLDEARIASLVDHPNVAHILDLGEQHGVLYLVMELVDGDPLQKLHRALEKKGMRIPLGIALRVLSDVCAGLDGAHGLRSADGQLLGVVHRDVSPQNVLVTSAGIAKVIDFGIAKAKNRVGAETTSGTLKGKVQFMAREQAAGNDVDARADLWAVGAILYFLIMGRSPYQAPNSITTLQSLMNEEPFPPIPDEFPAPVRDLVARALEHDITRRFQTGAEMRDAMDRAIVDARLMTSHAQVGAFVKEYLGPRIASRKKAIERALHEAQNRSRVSTVLKSPLDRPEISTGSGIREPASGAASRQPVSVPTSSGPRSLPTPRTAFVAAFEAPLPSAPIPSAPLSSGGSGPYPQHAGSSGPWPEQPANTSNSWPQQPASTSNSWPQQPDASSSRVALSPNAPTLAPPALAVPRRGRRRTLILVAVIIPGVAVGWAAGMFVLTHTARIVAKPIATHAPSTEVPASPTAQAGAPTAPAEAAAPGSTSAPQAGTSRAPPSARGQASTEARPPSRSSHTPVVRKAPAAPAPAPPPPSRTPKADDYGF